MEGTGVLLRGLHFRDTLWVQAVKRIAVPLTTAHGVVAVHVLLRDMRTWDTLHTAMLRTLGQ